MTIATGRRLVVLDPTTEPEPLTAARLPRPRSLAGLRVGLLDNGKLNAGRFLELLGEELKARHGVAETILLRKPNASRIVPEAMAAELAGRCDVVIAAVGD